MTNGLESYLVTLSALGRNGVRFEPRRELQNSAFSAPPQNKIHCISVSPLQGQQGLARTLGAVQGIKISPRLHLSGDLCAVEADFPRGLFRQPERSVRIREVMGSNPTRSTKSEKSEPFSCGRKVRIFYTLFSARAQPNPVLLIQKQGPPTWEALFFFCPAQGCRHLCPPLWALVFTRTFSFS